MKTVFSKSYLAGLAVYAYCIILAAAPIFTPRLSLESVIRLVGLAAFASLVVALINALGIDKRMRDEDSVFTQAMLGIGICAGMYGLLSPLDRPQVMVMSLLWIAVGLTHLSPRQVLVLVGLYSGIYAYFVGPTLFGTSQDDYEDALYTLVVSLVISGFLYMRAHEYEVVRKRHRAQAKELAQAETRIQEITTQDSETTALKFAYFHNELVKQKSRVDNEGGTFSVGLIEIDRYAEVRHSLGEAATGQLMRAFTERASALIHNMGSAGHCAGDHKPIGRIAGGRFGLILPMADFECAMKVAALLHDAIDFQAIRTHAGIVGLTLSIGVTEYAPKEDVDEVMELAARALTLAQAHNGNDFRGLKHPGSGVRPTKTGLNTWAGATRAAIANRLAH
jgi:GGDEF domain-containing protein